VASGHEATYESYFAPRRNLPRDLFKRLPWYPRHRGDPHLTELRRAVFSHLGIESAW